jgi:hypothetical protein
MLTTVGRQTIDGSHSTQGVVAIALDEGIEVSPSESDAASDFHRNDPSLLPESAEVPLGRPEVASCMLSIEKGSLQRWRRMPLGDSATSHALSERHYSQRSPALIAF